MMMMMMMMRMMMMMMMIFNSDRGMDDILSHQQLAVTLDWI